MKTRDRVWPARARQLLGLVLLLVGLAFRSHAQTISATGVPENSATMGHADAPVTIVEFSDFQCPFCRKVAPVVRELISAYPGKIRYEFRHSPLSIHPSAPLAHEAALAAGAQGRFWEMHDLLFANQRNLRFDDLVRYAQQLGLDEAMFRQALDEHRFRSEVERDRAEAQRLGIMGTPTFLVNGRQYRGALTRGEFDAIIMAELNGTSRAENGAAPEFKLQDALSAGPATAEVTVVAFSDFGCLHSRAMAETLTQLLSKYPDHVRVAFKHFPAPGNAQTRMAHQLAAAAAEQGKFWQWHERVFALRGDLRREPLMETARQVGLTGIQWVGVQPLQAFNAAVEADLAEGRRVGVRGTPTLFVNGTKIQGAQPLAFLEGMVKAELERVAQKTAPPASARTSRLARGPVDAPILIVWYSDVQSPLAARTADVLTAIERAFPRDVRVVFRHRPLEFHPEAGLAHQALAIAAEHDKFWEMLQLMHSHQNALGRSVLAAYAKRIGLNPNEFEAALESGRYRVAVEDDLTEARRLDIRGVPVLFVNKIRVEGVPEEYKLRQLVESQLRQTQAPRP